MMKKNSSQVNPAKESQTCNFTTQVRLSKTRRHKPIAPQMDCVVSEESPPRIKSDRQLAEFSIKIVDQGRNMQPKAA